MRVRLGRAGHAGRPAVPAAPYRTPRAYDLLDTPAAAGHRVLLQGERLGFPLGPVLAVPGVRGAAGGGTARGPAGGAARPAVLWSPNRLQFFVAAGSTGSLRADLAELGWSPEELDLRAVTQVIAAEAVLPPVGSPRWVRAPETERAASYPPAQLLLGSVAYACRRSVRGALGGSGR